eukprot:11329_4
MQSRLYWIRWRAVCVSPRGHVQDFIWDLPEFNYIVPAKFRNRIPQSKNQRFGLPVTGISRAKRWSVPDLSNRVVEVQLGRNLKPMSALFRNLR